MHRCLLRWPCPLAATALFLGVAGFGWAAEPVDLAPQLAAVREEFNFPAVAAAVIVEGRLHALGVAGVRKHGSEVKVQPDDPFHLGSCTKAMTGSLIGLLVEQGKLAWDTPLVEYFPEWKDRMHPDYHAVTLAHLLSHRAGVPPMTAGFAPLSREQLLEVLAMESPAAQRRRVAEIVLSLPPVNRPGEEELYSNAGFTLAGAVVETVMGEDYEDLLQRFLFEPLKIESAGFGAMGTAGRVDAPWQHRVDGEELVPVEPGPHSDNPPLITPAGRVHCSMTDWAKYIRCVLAAARGEEGLLPTSSVWQLKEPPFGGRYALGWGIHERQWGGGKVFSHSGSNRMNYCVVWIAPRKNFAVLAATNRGGDGAAEGLDKICGMMIQRFLTPTEAK